MLLVTLSLNDLVEGGLSVCGLSLEILESLGVWVGVFFKRVGLYGYTKGIAVRSYGLAFHILAHVCARGSYALDGQRQECLGGLVLGVKIWRNGIFFFSSFILFFLTTISWHGRACCISSVI